jgi:hypothetical protein
MQKKSKKKSRELLSDPFCSESFELVSRVRSTSTRKLVNFSRKFKNLSLIRSPSSELKKPVRQSPLPSHLKLKAVSQSWANRLKPTSSSYFNDCRRALDELSSHPHPISQVLRHIQRAFEEKVYEKSSPQVLDSISATPKSRDSTFLNRIQIRRFSNRRNKLIRVNHGENPGNSIPKLKISSIGSRGESGKGTGTTTETSKYKFQDYQEEFMSKFHEFSESWRQQILLQANPG